MFSLQQNWRTRGQNRFCQEAGRWVCRRRAEGGSLPEQHTHVSKCKNDKRKNKILNSKLHRKLYLKKTCRKYKYVYQC
jgi:hypothetical protein